VSDREKRPTILAASMGLDVERWVWAEHLVDVHGPYGTANATPCDHVRGRVGDEKRTRNIVAEYNRLSVLSVFDRVDRFPVTQRDRDIYEREASRHDAAHPTPHLDCPRCIPRHE
jgi:hypothetical protein